jgi:hypothetical protein
MASRARDKNAWSVGVHAWPFARLMQADPAVAMALFPNPNPSQDNLTLIKYSALDELPIQNNLSKGKKVKEINLQKCRAVTPGVLLDALTASGGCGLLNKKAALMRTPLQALVLVIHTRPSRHFSQMAWSWNQERYHWILKQTIP